MRRHTPEEALVFKTHISNSLYYYRYTSKKKNNWKRLSNSLTRNCKFYCNNLPNKYLILLEQNTVKTSEIVSSHVNTLNSHNT